MPCGLIDGVDLCWISDGLVRNAQRERTTPIRGKYYCS